MPSGALARLVSPVLLGALALGAVFPPPAPARELWSGGDLRVEWFGSLREIVTVTRGTDQDDFAERFEENAAVCLPAETFPECPAFEEVGDTRVWTSLTRLRGRLEARYGEHVVAVVAYDQELLAGTLDTFERQSLGRSFASDTWIDAQGRILTLARDRAEWRHRLYRGFVQLESEHLEVSVGRQRVAWGVGRLWNPIDRFNPIPPLALEADQSPGVDALVVRWLPTGFDFIEAVIAPQDHLDDGAYALRAHGVVRNVDVSLVAGVFEEALTFGFDLAANVGPAAARAEVVYTDPERKVWPVGADRARELDSFWQVLISVDHRFDWGPGVTLLVEHLYNGNDLGFGRGRAGPLLGLFEETAEGLVRPADADVLGGSRVVTLAENQTGVQVGTELTPELRADVLVIYDWNGESAAFFPALHYSPTGWLELTLGGQLFAGPRRSQYGDAETLGLLIAEVFF